MKVETTHKWNNSCHIIINKYYKHHPTRLVCIRQAINPPAPLQISVSSLLSYTVLHKNNMESNSWGICHIVNSENPFFVAKSVVKSNRLKLLSAEKAVGGYIFEPCYVFLQKLSFKLTTCWLHHRLQHKSYTPHFSHLSLYYYYYSILLSFYAIIPFYF